MKLARHMSQVGLAGLIAISATPVVLSLIHI